MHHGQKTKKKENHAKLGMWDFYVRFDGVFVQFADMVRRTSLIAAAVVLHHCLWCWWFWADA